MTPRQAALVLVIAGVLILIGSLPIGAWLTGGPGLLLVAIGLVYRDRPLSMIARIVVTVVAAAVLWLVLPDLNSGIPSIWLMTLGAAASGVVALLAGRVVPDTMKPPPPG